MNRKRPNKLDYVSLIILLIAFSNIVLVSIYILNDSNPYVKGVDKEPLQMTLGEFYGLMAAIIIGAIVLLFPSLILSPIFETLQHKNRPEYQIDE